VVSGEEWWAGLDRNALQLSTGSIMDYGLGMIELGFIVLELVTELKCSV
jgi:hypothetical protein